MSLETERFYEFGPFRLDAGERLLFRDSERVELAPRVLDTLILLVENHEHLVTKDELIRKLWPDTFVEESNLTFNISTLRKVLGDDRNNGNRFIETVPKRGYRFIAAVRLSGPAKAITERNPLQGAVLRPSMRRRWLLWFGAAALAAIGGVAFADRITGPLPPPTVSTYTRLTRDGSEKDSSSAVLTDGLNIYYVQQNDKTLAVSSVSSLGGEPAAVATFSTGVELEDISPNRHELLIRHQEGLWRQPVPAGPAEELPNFTSIGAVSLSTDGRMMVFSKGHSIYRAKADGSDPRRVVDISVAGIEGLRVSPDGKVVRFTVVSGKDRSQSLWEVRLDGSHLRPLLPNWPEQQCCGNWTSDGKYFFFASYMSPPAFAHNQIWALREGTSLWRRSTHEPVQITHSSQDFSLAVSSRDSKQLFAIGVEKTGELMDYDNHARSFVRYLDGLSAAWVTFPADGQKIAYEKFPDSTLWVANRDGSGARQLTFHPMVVDGLSFAPDGKEIAFRGQTPGRPFKIRLIATDGTEPQGHDLIPDHDQEEGIPTWSPDGSKIAFGDVPRPFGNDDGTHAIRVFDLQTHNLSSLSGSQGLWSARWSPDGRYMAALTISIPEKLEIFEF